MLCGASNAEQHRARRATASLRIGEERREKSGESRAEELRRPSAAGGLAGGEEEEEEEDGQRGRDVWRGTRLGLFVPCGEARL